MTERFITINKPDGFLAAMLHLPQDVNPLKIQNTGVLVITGGPQYRVGSHRQFVKLSRALALQNICSMRLDSRGMGDSSGIKAPFYTQQQDIELAITAFLEHCPQLQKVILWGLCDGASAILIQLNQNDSRIVGAILLNPWVRQNHSHADLMLKHYYPRRIFNRDFWRRLFTGEFKLSHALDDFRHSIEMRKTRNLPSEKYNDINEHNYVDHMLKGLQKFNGKILLICSGNDLTAQEFLQLCRNENAWAHCLASAEKHHLPNANHTFSCNEWRLEVERLTIRFCQSQDFLSGNIMSN